ncbi:MAG: hypothetical protein AAGC65_22200 [Mucilaginibacter sp.]|uniref:exosortase Y-associated Wzy-like protein n=1 Tax=Mucilaginibacter sp. TaxID=1882438 RepID=UPI0031A97B4C
MPAKQFSLERIIVLYIPWMLSILLKNDYELSYLIAWLGSFLIFFLTLTGWVTPLPHDRPVSEQLMRPIFLVQIIFAGYMACTSIFYFMDVLGYDNFEKLGTTLTDHNRMQYTAQCQQYYCLGHAAFVTGILVFMRYPVQSVYYIEKQKLANLLMLFAIISFPVSLIFLKLPGLSQFYYQLNTLSFIAGTLALAFAIPLRKAKNIVICLLFYFFNFYQALVSGFKEPIIISVLVLGIFLYPSFKKLVIVIFIPILLLLFVLLPTYNHAFRQSAWSDDQSAEQASQQAIDATLNAGSNDLDESNWDFLVYRLSEIDMFIRFTQSTPKNIDFYGTTLLTQSGIALIPRVFWPAKPSTEDLIMERVYAAGVINRASTVSAKPAFVVDAYLSAGGYGVFLFLLIYGAVAQLISIKAESLFGGYIFGTALIFSGLFQIMWRGISFEFIINSVFWSYITMLVIHRLLLSTHILKRI